MKRSKRFVNNSCMNSFIKSHSPELEQLNVLENACVKAIESLKVDQRQCNEVIDEAGEAITVNELVSSNSSQAKPIYNVAVVRTLFLTC